MKRKTATSNKAVLKICRQGHSFYKSSDCPVCPLCAVNEKNKLQNDFPKNLGAPALRALDAANIKKLADLSRHTENEIANLHGMGPTGITKLKTALKTKKLSFKKK